MAGEPTRWEEATHQPDGDVEVRQQPDGTFLLGWRYGRQQINLILTLTQLRQLNSDGLHAMMLAKDPEKVEQL